MRPSVLIACAAFAACATIGFVGCGSNASRDQFGDDGSPTSSGGGGTPPGGSLGGGDAHPPCEGLACQQVACPAGATTTVSGIVTAPNGTLPLYAAVVYVPNAPLDPLADGASCDRCGSVSGKPLVATLTGVDGKFVLKDVPVGSNIPLVVQVGKWRREVKLPSVTACTDNPIADASTTRLPKNQSEGHIPSIAVTTGRCDQLACLLPKLGLDPSEYSAPGGTGRLHLYRGAADASNTNPSMPVAAPAPTGTPDATALWSDPKTLARYDMVMLSCECAEHAETKTDASKQALYDFTKAGGRVFASHYHYIWAQGASPLAGAAQWLGGSSSNASSTPPYQVDTSFPKGAAFAQWLVDVGAATKLGEIPISQPREDVGSVVAPTQRWVYGKRWAVPNVIPDPIVPESTKYLNVATPVGVPVDQQCGKFVFADMHLYGGDIQDPKSALPDDSFPSSCSTTMTPEEKALAFLFFDLSSCVGDDTKPPTPPVN